MIFGVLSRRPTCFRKYCTQQFGKVGGHQKLAGALERRPGSLFSAFFSAIYFVRKSYGKDMVGKHDSRETTCLCFYMARNVTEFLVFVWNSDGQAPLVRPMAKPMSLDDDSRCHDSCSFSGIQRIPITATQQQQTVGWSQFTAHPQDSSSI